LNEAIALNRACCSSEGLSARCFPFRPHEFTKRWRPEPRAIRPKESFMIALSNLDYGIIGAFLIVILAVGLAASRLASRNL
jgi:hypothetical protein